MFSLIIVTSTIPIGTLFMIFWIPFPNRKKLFDIAASCWCKFILLTLKITTGIDYKILGKEKIQENRPYIIVAKHESTWETLIMHTIIKPSPIYILKKELLLIPFFGWVLKLADKIAIDRKGGAKSIKKILKESKEYIKDGHSIIIFPQGTRVPFNSATETYPYKTGFIALIKEMGIDILPVALNSGKYWSKKQFLKYPGTITMEFMDPIKYEDIKKMTKDELLKKLEYIIENKSKELNKI